MQKHPYYQGVTRATIQKSFAMEAPAWSWTYRFPGRSFEVKFLDQTYQGRYVTADESTKLLAELESSSPTSFGDALPGRITRIFATTAATAAGTAATAPTAGSIGAATIVGAAASAASASGAATASTAATVGAAASAASASGAATASTAATVGAAASAASVSGPATAATTTTTSSAAASAPASASGEAVTRYHVAVGLPPWLRDRPDDWWRQTDVEVVIRDAKYEKVAFRKRRVQAESVYRPDSGGEMIVYADDFDLPPGEYWLEAQVVDQHIDEHGSMRRRLEVPDFRDGRLRMSDLELAFPMDSTASGPAMSRHGRRYRPNPLAMVGDARRLNVLYEIYHVPDPAAARIQARYTILPRGYVVGIADLIRRGVIAADDPRRFGSLGMQLGGITLTRENYSDLYFPEEVVQADSAGIIPRGAALDLTDLQAGEYAVIATVTELASGQSASAIVGFRVTSDAELKALLDP
ncbi:MAG: hypothetical protein R3E12_13695 [Candidatus Eisenbacteria bacterium]